MPQGEQDFERAFGALAYTEMEQRAPGLTPYLIGFQLVKKNDDGSHAVGIFGFKVGEQWYYCPVFWLNGKLKGFDLLYIVSQDIFVPLEESWINYIKNRKPNILGEPEQLRADQLGAVGPDFTLFKRSPLTKVSVAAEFKDFERKRPWAHPAAMYLPPSDDKFAGVEKRSNLINVLKTQPPEMTAALLGQMTKNAAFADAVFKFYKPSEINALAKTACSKSCTCATCMKKKATKKIKSASILYGTKDALLHKEAAEDLMKGLARIQDDRSSPERTEVYNYEDVLQNPSSPGVYNILMNNGSLKRGLIIMNPISIGEAEVPAGVICVVIPEEGIHVNMHSSDVWVRPGDTKLSLKGLTSKELTAVKVGDFGVIVNDDFSGTFPFKVNMVNGDVLCVGPKYEIKRRETLRDLHSNPPASCGNDYVNNTYDSWKSHCDEVERNKYYDKKEGGPRCDGHHILIGEVPKTPRQQGRTVNVNDTLMVGNKTAKFVSINTDKTPGLELGGWKELEMKLRKEGMYKLALKSDGDEFAISFRENNTYGNSTKDTLKTLVEKVGMPPKIAVNLMKNAQVKGRVQTLIKFSMVYDPVNTATYDNMYNASVVQPMDQSTTVYPQEGANIAGYKEEPPDPNAQGSAIQAANADQKEVFDLAVLSGLIKTTDVDSATNELLKDIIIGNDRVGRILFMYYWHYSKFAERYGDEDMVELEDTLLNVFKSCGDLVLFLKQRSIMPNDVATGAVIDIGDSLT